ncbi:MAG: DUF4845 domain-containing protein [Burkholderiales bacterium]
MKKQKGMGILVIMVLLVVAGFAVLVALKLIPVYMENMQLRQVFASLSQDPDLASMTVPQVRSTFERHADVDNIKVVTARDLEISKGGGGTTVSVKYSVKVPLVANVSLVVDFAESTGGK